MSFGNESEVLEFKKTTGELSEAIIDIVAMLNKHGKGTVYFGVKNDGTVCGMDINDSTTRYVSTKIYEQIKPQIYPSISVETYNGLSVVKVSFEGKKKPYSAEGKYDIRVSDESRELNPIELVNMIMNENYATWEELTSNVTIDDVDDDIMMNFLEKAIKYQRIENMEYDKKTLLSKLNLIASDGIHLNNAGKYLFSNKKPITLKMAVFATDVKQTFIDMTNIEGNIFECIDLAEKYVKAHINWKVEIEGFERVEIPEIPINALREIIVNSFAHANYVGLSKNEINIHPNRVAIYNPGSFPDGYNPEDFVNNDLSSKIRNELICKTLFKCKAVETWGTGLRNTFNLCESKNIKLGYEKEHDGFWFFFYRTNVTNYVTVNDTIKLTEIEQKVLIAIKNNPKITREILSAELNRTSRQIQRVIDSLKEKKLIERIGSSKGGYWRCN